MLTLHVCTHVHERLHMYKKPGALINHWQKKQIGDLKQREDGIEDKYKVKYGIWMAF